MFRPFVAPQGFARPQSEGLGAAATSAGLRGLGQLGNTAAALLQRNAPVLPSALGGEAPQQTGFAGAQTNPNQPANAALFNVGSELTEGNRPTAVIITGDGTPIKNGIYYTYQLVDGNADGVRGYEVKENTEVVSIEGDQNFGKLNDNKSFIRTGSHGTFKDDVSLPRSIPISSDSNMIITAEQ